MSVLEVVLTLALLAAVIALVSGPLRAAREPTQPETGRAELESEREAKYREIRDAELDYRTGKLSREDYEAVSAALRAEAVAILDRLEAPERDPEHAGWEPAERDADMRSEREEHPPGSPK
jgi:hypothetical protein